MDEDKAKKAMYAVAKLFGFSTVTVFADGCIGMRGYGKFDCDAVFVAKHGNVGPYMPAYADTRFFSWNGTLEKIAGCKLSYSVVGGKDCSAIGRRPSKNRVIESAGVEDLIIKLELEGVKL